MRLTNLEDWRGRAQDDELKDRIPDVDLSRWIENECRECGQPCGPFLVCFGCGPEEYGYERKSVQGLGGIR